ncbi:MULTISPECIES: hypothetical protein [Pseudoalteromonas]|uniref:Uncharacterized protein n=1 Tax=Pseudoalteromonas luteoviolacea (strain 2ta16) TaxID=1353533 RepID=V4HMZ4_PSEL2|nr:MULTISPECIES: hypothetical protein [Pseudoalteromonas]ESP91153.1 hypothetical protein PL2TA16_01160 [Pseudoalteromonas luteoviolacea 2ta16]KZN41314.1 hypothetical protein N483_15575 [Pseudoalteromonas luteoviolacea NCIMB 1944]MCG7550207.1 hypothetical protein [Pseudoalteromonas sp. Of7M-16]
MKLAYRLLIAFILLVAALSAYSYGNANGVFAFVILGVVFEAAFWLRLFPKKAKKSVP